jgi:hypothetical protein
MGIPMVWRVDFAPFGALAKVRLAEQRRREKVEQQTKIKTGGQLGTHLRPGPIMGDSLKALHNIYIQIDGWIDR